jgi:biopolymer transport protein ExbB
VKRLLWPLYFIGALAVSWLIYLQLPKYIREGGFLVAGLIFLLILVTTFVIERAISLRRAAGRGSLPAFLTTVKRHLASGDVDAAIDACKKQGGSAANVIRSGLERFKSAKADGLAKEKIITETQEAIEEANGLERPLLERNLIALSTIASIATMVGLLGTVLGMIRSFNALGTSGAVDAAKLALGISEALVNTAGGLMVAIVGIIFYNVFTTKVDNFSYMIDEASFEAVQFLSTRAD